MYKIKSSSVLYIHLLVEIMSFYGKKVEHLSPLKPCVDPGNTTEVEGSVQLTSTQR
jgi:hypothetical protein